MESKSSKTFCDLLLTTKTITSKQSLQSMVCSMVSKFLSRHKIPVEFDSQYLNEFLKAVNSKYLLTNSLSDEQALFLLFYFFIEFDFHAFLIDSFNSLRRKVFTVKCSQLVKSLQLPSSNSSTFLESFKRTKLILRKISINIEEIGSLAIKMKNLLSSSDLKFFLKQRSEIA